MSTAVEIQARIAEYAEKLAESEITKRVKKRVLQMLGKLKKQLSDLTAGKQNSFADVTAKDTVEDAQDNFGKASQPLLTHKEMKLKLRIINKEIAEFAQSKQLKNAVKSFQRITKKGMKPDLHSYTNLINVYMRCNDVDGAEKILHQMLQQQIQPNVITYTIMIKGYGEVGMIQKAKDIFYNKLVSNGNKSNCLPNLRTLNAFLRCCNRVGAINTALQAYQHYKILHVNNSSPKELSDDENSDNDAEDGNDNVNKKIVSNGNSAHGDASTYEYLIGLCCQAFDINSANTIANELITVSSDSDNNPLENAAIYMNLTRLYAMLGLVDAAKKWMLLANRAIELLETSNLRETMKEKFKETIDYDSYKKTNNSASNSSKRSVELFLTHRRTELQHEIQLIEDFLVLIKSITTTPTRTAGNHSLIGHACIVLLFFLSHVYYFGFDNNCDLQQSNTDNGDEGSADPDKSAKKKRKLSTNEILSITNDTEESMSLSTRLIYVLKEKFGLDRLKISEVISGSNVSISTTNSSENKVMNKLVKKAKENMVLKIINSVDDENRLNLYGLFSTFNVDNHDVNSSVAVGNTNKLFQSLPINLEIGAGNGDWIVAQADASYDKKRKNSEEPATDNNIQNKKRNKKKKELPVVNDDRVNIEILKAQMITDSDEEDEENDLTIANKSSEDYQKILSAERQRVGYPKALWIGMELRCDRIFNCFAHNYLNSSAKCFQLLHNGNNTEGNSDKPLLNNLAFVGGDAEKILSSRFPDNKISGIFINHPQPPDRITGGINNSSQGKHLLTKDFFMELHRILLQTGTITIVTDNFLYSKLLAEELVDLSNDFKAQKSGDHQKGFFVSKSIASESCMLEETYDVSVGESKEVVEIWRGEPGPDCGHIVPASSYFDRMWASGHKTRRWFLFLQKK